MRRGFCHVPARPDCWCWDDKNLQSPGCRHRSPRGWEPPRCRGGRPGQPGVEQSGPPDKKRVRNIVMRSQQAETRDTFQSKHKYWTRWFINLHQTQQPTTTQSQPVITTSINWIKVTKTLLGDLRGNCTSDFTCWSYLLAPLFSNEFDTVRQSVSQSVTAYNRYSQNPQWRALPAPGAPPRPRSAPRRRPVWASRPARCPGWWSWRGWLAGSN